MTSWGTSFGTAWGESFAIGENIPEETETIIRIAPAGVMSDLKDGRAMVTLSSGRTFINVE